MGALLTDMTDSIKELTSEIRSFVDARGWLSRGRADLKGIAISISLEAAELLELFQWVKDDEVEARVEKHQEDIADELADVAIYTFQFADRAGIDLAAAIRRKMEKNGEKYPVETK